MIRALLVLVVALVVALILALWRVDVVTGHRDRAVTAAEESEARVTSLRSTLRLQRELSASQAATETKYLTERDDAQEESERLRRCIADGTCGLRVAATCVRVDGAATAAGQPDAATPRLTASAERAYPALVAGLKTQRAQIAGLQEQLITLHSKCRIGG